MSGVFSLVLAISTFGVGVFAGHNSRFDNIEAEIIAEPAANTRLMDVNSDKLLNIVLDLQRKVLWQEKRIQVLEKRDGRRERAFRELLFSVRKLEKTCDIVGKKVDVHLDKEQATDIHKTFPKGLGIPINRPVPALHGIVKNTPVPALHHIVKKQAVREAGNIGFTAYIDHTIDHMSVGHTIKMNQVLLNDGGAYNTMTGIFTVPVSGVYLFNFHYNSHFRKTIIGLFLDGKDEVDAISVVKDSTQEIMGSNTAILRVSVGQSVWLQEIIVNEGEIFTGQLARYVTFSGVLLYKDAAL